MTLGKPPVLIQTYDMMCYQCDRKHEVACEMGKLDNEDRLCPVCSNVMYVPPAHIQYQRSQLGERIPKDIFNDQLDNYIKFDIGEPPVEGEDTRGKFTYYPTSTLSLTEILTNFIEVLDVHRSDDRVGSLVNNLIDVTKYALKTVKRDQCTLN